MVHGIHHREPKYLRHLANTRNDTRICSVTVMPSVPSERYDSDGLLVAHVAWRSTLQRWQCWPTMVPSISSACLGVVVVLGTVWVAFNLPGLFGYHRFGLTVYSGIPFPRVDLVIHTNGLPGIRGSKAHWVSAEEFDQLIGARADDYPDVVIIGTGYEGQVQVEGGILTREADPIVELLPTPQAICRFNELRAAGKRVVAIIHSTC